MRIVELFCLLFLVAPDKTRLIIRDTPLLLKKMESKAKIILIMSLVL